MMHTLRELMIVTTAREIKDGEVVFVGMRLPMMAFALAKRLHAPHAVGLFECGVVRDEPATAPLVTMGDPPNILGAWWAGNMGTVMGLLAQGHVHLGLLGGAQIDRYGNLNTSYIGGYIKPQIRLPGSGGASDIACLSQRTVLIMPHEKRRFVEEVDYMTSPGYGTSMGWREGVGLPKRNGSHPYGGPDAVITTLGILRFDEEGEMVLTNIHPGVKLEDVLDHTDWALQVVEELTETMPPTEEELAILRELVAN